MPSDAFDIKYTFLQDWKKYVNDDGLHLAKEGAQLVAERLIPKLEKITANCTEIFPDWSTVDNDNPSASFK